MSAIDKPVIIDGEIEFAEDSFTDEEIAELKEVLSPKEFEEELKWMKNSTIKD